MMNQRLSQKINLMTRLLHLLKDGSLHESTRLIIVSLIRVLLVTYKTTNDIVKYGCSARESIALGKALF